ncbi:MAG TPA: bifunctional demethylmenaquinone methyltransferase/2-methoxy-6-polyprenyl-1,4-benzoquinol methylase UbiE [Fimbriiglobus sp.]
MTVATPRLLDKREDRIRRMFGQIAPRYDFLNHLLSFNVDKRWRTRTVKLVPPLGDGPVLDLCTGTGDLAFAFDRAAKGTTSIVGADFCHEMLVRAAAKAAKLGVAERVTFVEADAQDLPFPTGTFQIVAVAFGLRNVTDTDKGLAEMVRVARPGGRVAVLEFSKPTHWLFGRAYRWYFHYLLPFIGHLFCRNRESAYSYLPESVLAFPSGEALAETMRTHGLADVTVTPFTFGIATLYVGTKSP